MGPQYVCSRPLRSRAVFNHPALPCLGPRRTHKNIHSEPGPVNICSPFPPILLGFYVLDPSSHGKGLVLGPFMGQVACQTIDFGRGVCGTAAATKQTQLVPDVDAFPGHIACDGASRSEIVVPVTVDVVSPEEGGHVEKKVVGISELPMSPSLFFLFSSASQAPGGHMPSQFAANFSEDELLSLWDG